VVLGEGAHSSAGRTNAENQMSNLTATAGVCPAWHGSRFFEGVYQQQRRHLRKQDGYAEARGSVLPWSECMESRNALAHCV
jgi:hypothetical protein